MENPNAWGELEREIDVVFAKHADEGREGICGHSIVFKLAEFVRTKVAGDCATREDLIASFIQGARWCEWVLHGSEMSAEDRNLAEEAARKWVELEYRTVREK